MERRSGNTLDDENDRIVICSSASYCYFTLSILLFSVGTVITILALDENDGVFSNLTHMWLVGPLFISSGLMVAVKTIMYLRKETMIMFLTRQRTLLRVSSLLCDLHQNISVNQYDHTMLSFKFVECIVCSHIFMIS